MLWITRPSQDSAKQCKNVNNLGYKAYAETLLDIEIYEKTVDTTGCQAVIFTSANGVRSYSENGGDTNLPVFAVGDATKIEAVEKGFEIIHTASGDVIALSDIVKETLNPADGALYHAAGSVIAKDLSALLSDFCYTIKREVLYSAVPVVNLTNTVQEYIKDSSISGVLLMSPRTADIFVAIVRTHGLDTDIKNVVIFALSDAVAEKVRFLGCKICVADGPTNADLMEQIKNEFK